MTIHKERHVFGSYAHGIQGSGSPALSLDLSVARFQKDPDGKADFDQKVVKAAVEESEKRGSDMDAKVELAPVLSPLMVDNPVRRRALATIRPRKFRGFWCEKPDPEKQSCM